MVAHILAFPYALWCRILSRKSVKGKLKRGRKSEKRTAYCSWGSTRVPRLREASKHYGNDDDYNRRTKFSTHFVLCTTKHRPRLNLYLFLVADRLMLLPAFICGIICRRTWGSKEKLYGGIGYIFDSVTQRPTWRRGQQDDCQGVHAIRRSRTIQIHCCLLPVPILLPPCPLKLIAASGDVRCSEIVPLWAYKVVNAGS